ncbi:MAG: hypothetical protein AB7O77_12690 [Phycisphaerales bacterium]
MRHPPAILSAPSRFPFRFTSPGARIRTLIWIPVAALAAISMVGCAATNGLTQGFEPLNSENGPGGGVVLDTLDPSAAPRHDYAGPTPSVVGVERDNWQPTTILVPGSTVYHHTIYTDDKPRFATDTARARGQYPTQSTALDAGTSEPRGALALEGLAAPIRAMSDIVRFPFRAVFNKNQRPLSVHRSPIPSEPFARAPEIASQYDGKQSALKPTITGSPVPGTKKPVNLQSGGASSPDQGTPPPIPPARPGSPESFQPGKPTR